MVLQSFGCPVLEGGQWNLLWLGTAIGPGSRFGQVLLMIILRVVEGRQGALEVGGCHNFGGDARSFTFPCSLQSLLIGIFTGTHQLLLLTVEVDQGASVLRVSVLRPSVVALSIALGWVMRLPEPTEQVHGTDLLGVIDHLHCFSGSSAPGATLLISWVGRLPCSITHRRGMDTSTWQSPEAFFGAPKAAVGQDANFHVGWPGPFHGCFQDEMTGAHLHLFGAALQCSACSSHLCLR
mmetsp:Transcript_7779/g.13454  ORF Transcript_7779/g.13454 Transcript_7779/m.13454 type:complete len:237 (+) Transcript_7779:186-896(+)